jgi:exodeoxyribonuclease VII large subunit
VAVYTVSQVTTYLRDSLENDPLLADLWVVGEVSNLRVSSSGHSYFTVKDDHSILNCVMFKGQRGGDLLANGTAVSAHGRITFYSPRGSTDFMVDVAVPEGLGELALELERLRLRLEAEGLFEVSRKRPLPLFPQVVGVVTSPAGAVFHDIQNVVQRRFPLTELVLAPTPVQGSDGAAGIVSAIERLQRETRADVIIVARGGGSLEELWPFNEEIVARAIYASRVPVVSGVGHETDFTIADYVADVRAPTPSAAAELVVPDHLVLRRRTTELADQYWRAFAGQLESRRDSVRELMRRMETGLPDGDSWRRRLDDLAQNINKGLTARLTLTRSRIDGLDRQLRALDPVATLGRGFSMVQHGDTGQVVKSTSQVTDGAPLEVTVADGVFEATAGTGAKPLLGKKKRKASSPSYAMERLL